MPVTVLVTPGTGSHERHADPLGRTGIGVGCMNSGLLVADQDMLDLFLLEQCIIDMKHGAAGIAENAVDLFFLQAPDYNFCTADHHDLPNKAVA